jgi:hypothetical protein
VGRWVVVVVVLLLGAGCRQILGIEDLSVGGGRDGGGGQDGAAGADGAGAGDSILPTIDAAVFDAVPRDACGTVACANCLDDDVDGRVDYDDPECTSPLDGNEGTFATDIPGDNIDACTTDCFFDGNSGSGDDMCQVDRTCDGTAATSALYAACGACNDTDVPPECSTFCRRFQPNGCDCLGCCTVFVGSSSINVILEKGCDYELELGDPDQCPPCAKTAACANPCDPCEYCIGRDPVGPCAAADAGACAVPCNPHERDACGTGSWCLTGCCVSTAAP